LKLRGARLEALIWVLIYGGLIVAVLGIALERNGARHGSGIVTAGALAVAAGIVLVWVRSRLTEP
jgi:hypothetical protein